MTRRPARALTMLGALLTLSACGPSAPFEVAVRSYAGDVAYGAQSAPAPAPAQAPLPVELPPGAPPLIYGAPAPPPQPTATPPRPSGTALPDCPTAPAGAAANLPAEPFATTPPSPGSYAWRQAGTFRQGTGTAQAFLPKLAHTVGNVSAPDATGSYSFDVTTSSGGLNGLQRVTTSYQVVPPSPAGSNVLGVPATQAAGIYVTAMVMADSSSPNTRLARFAPPLLILQFPASEQPAWSTKGTDSGSGDTLQLSAAVTGHARVDACGTVIDAWEVHATGSLTGPDQTLSLDLTYDVATQYGGLIVREKDSIGGTQLSGGSMVPVASSVEATASAVPRRGGAQ
ncbi:MAG TPA: hypothetical protein VGQ42_13800 [Candidatus Dormibacteraeota bacterium]|jgi:hypothetical protein|nr:hypothetical protein [Candidatus Dormibacteraeota bacterium]